MSETTNSTSRRDLLQLAGLGVPAAATVMVTGTPAQATVEAAGEGLRKTAHVEKYLESARF
ncbi:MAG: twin-arginine translocation pathway signal protein [Pseudomonadota bacterium]